MITFEKLSSLKEHYPKVPIPKQLISQIKVYLWLVYSSHFSKSLIYLFCNIYINLKEQDAIQIKSKTDDGNLISYVY